MVCRIELLRGLAYLYSATTVQHHIGSDKHDQVVAVCSKLAVHLPHLHEMTTISHNSTITLSLHASQLPAIRSFTCALDTVFSQLSSNVPACLVHGSFAFMSTCCCCFCYHCCCYYYHYYYCEHYPCEYFCYYYWCYLLLQVACHHLSQILWYPQIPHCLDHHGQYAGSVALPSLPRPLRPLQRVKHAC